MPSSEDLTQGRKYLKIGATMTELASGNLIELRVAQLLHTPDRLQFRDRDLDKEAEESVRRANWLISFEHDGGSRKATNQYLSRLRMTRNGVGWSHRILRQYRR